MKYLKSLILFLTVSTMSLTFSSCNNSTDKKEQTGKEYTAKYVCPMHCEGSGSEEPGQCPVCGMDYVENTEHKSDGHKHD
ncbi:heavy metal-binding domain-containing protein [Portibacter marinus]|uniref:heavy metal-binding domain-containing protein n=1 Tax=Portibacter marinus TaxID=2898660 RepID=UPI001F48F27C|nr:heavy metal-binding domain-containing protein [Portibacter marinus]